MAGPISSGAAPAATHNPGTRYGPALALLASLFFMWGFITVINNTLLPHLRSVFDLSYTQTTLIESVWFIAYFFASIPSAKLIVDVVVLVAVASCLNSALYTASRMLFSLGRRGQAPDLVNRTTGQGVPRFAVLGSTLVGFVAVIANYAFPEEVFAALLATSGAIALLVYLVIAVSQLRMRRVLERDGVAMPVRMWGYPVLTWAVIVVIPVVLVYMATREGSRFELGMTALIAAGVVGVGVLLTRRRARAVVR